MDSIALFSVLVVCMVSVYAEDIKKPYFVEVTLDCWLNMSMPHASNIHKRYWIFPNGKTYDSDSDAPICRNEKCWTMDPTGYNITLKRINDEDFGVYYCINVMHDNTIHVERRGLNVDGPYYGDLLEQYKENAMVGGIAAAVLFVFLAGSCLLWNCRYNKRKGIKGDMGNGDLTDINMVHSQYDNKAMDLETNEKL